MPVLRSALLSAGTPGYGVLLTIVEHAGLYAVLEQATTPERIRDPRLLSEGSDLRVATATFEALRARAVASTPELPRSPQVLRYLAAMEVATAPRTITEQPSVRASRPLPSVASEPTVTSTTPLAIAPSATPLATSIDASPARRLRRGSNRRTRANDEIAVVAELAAYASTEESLEPVTPEDWRALAPRPVIAAAEPIIEIPPSPVISPRTIESERTPPMAMPPTPPVAPPLPRLSVDEIIARAFGRRPAPALPVVEPGPAPERVSRALIAERLVHGAYASAPALEETAEIEIDRQGIVTVHRGSAEQLPAYLPAMAGVRAEIGFIGDQIVVHDLLSIDGRDLRSEPLWRRYVTAMECSSVAGIAVVPLLPHPRRAVEGERISVRDLRAPYGRAGSWMSAD